MKKVILSFLPCLLFAVLLLSSCFKVVPETPTAPATEPPGTTVSTPATTPTTTPAPIPASTTPSVTPSSTINPSPTKPPPEMALIAFTRYNNAAFEERIYTVKNDGTDLKKLTTEDNVQEHFPDFSPDGKKIVFAKMVKDGQFDVYVMNSDGSGRVNLTNTPNIREDMPAWSPDGQQIAFSLSNDIYVMAADGTKPVKLTTDTAFDWVPAWSPDGKEIAFLSNRDGNWKWWVMKADGSNQRLLADIIVMEEARGVPVFLLKGTWSLKFPGTFFSPLLTKEKQCVISIDVEKGKQGTITYGDSKNYLEVRGNNSPVVTLYTAKTSSFDIYNAWGTPVKEIVNTSDHEIAGSCTELVPAGQTTALTPTTSPSPTPPTPTQTHPLPPMDAFMKGIYFADMAPFDNSKPVYGFEAIPPPPQGGPGSQPPPPRRGLYTPPEADQSLKNLAATGANWIALPVEVGQETISSTKIFRSQTATATDPELQRVVDLAHSLGLRVLLMPLLHLSNDPTHAHIHIGTAFTSEAQWQEWFASYREFINHYATFAQEAGVDMLFIGNELGATTHREADWRRVIQEVRQRFKGPITYDSLCGPFPDGEYQHIQWWDAVDYIGIGGYNPLTDKNNPTVAELEEAWTNKGYLASMENISKKFNKPVIISEIGYMSKDGTNQRPAGYREDGPLDLQEQADCYQAALEVLMGKPWLRGIFWFQWYANPGLSAGGPNDKDFTPQSKPAEEVLKKYYLEK